MKATLHKCYWIDKENKVAHYSMEEIEITNKTPLDSLQDLVGGYIEVYLHNGRHLIFNEDGLTLELPRNPFAVDNGFFIVGSIIEVHGKLK